MRIHLCLALLALAAAAGIRAEDGEKAKQLIVHEWGTFSGIAGSDGAPLHFYPNNNDLPTFVYKDVLKLKDGLYSTVSLETPVTYFYAREAIKVKVKASFPGGVFSEWFPQATAELEDKGGTIEWSEVEVLPGEKAKLPGAGESGRYFRARETDANTLRVKTEKTEADERFLFYRGAGGSKLPLRVSNTQGTFTLANQGEEPIAAFFAVNVKDNKVTFVTGGEIKDGADARVDFHKVSEGADALGEALAKALVAQGLYEKEARAMVATWRDAWLEEDGNRVLYLMNTKVSDRLIPLQITPKPEEIVRVMVGRQDVFTPEQEVEFKLLAAELKNGSPETKEKATKAFDKLGRWAMAARERVEQMAKHE
ncbi:MAG: hypothetical protein HY291_03095 [Planctomycetes bacterium]|nr:hypothetical protein [Planctomycetota bacterium]